ncbi:hypothetical protein ACFWYA_19880 [Streptomyces sp. NPDC059011]|uniref:hypothetical protein n=1 Tax=unclassified Streptomyces TaxID=2593676 RepID=UPI003697E16B
MLLVLRYRNGDREPLDMEIVREALVPHMVAADGDLMNGVLIRTVDGHESTWTSTRSASPSTAFRPAGSSTSWPRWWTRLGASVPPTDLPVTLREEEDRAHLPAGAGENAVVVAMTGPDLEGYLCRS